MSGSECAAMVSDAQQASLGSQIQISVYAKQLQAQKQAGESVVQLLNAAVQLSKEAGKGDGFDGSA